jgi:hypothetical protein
LATSSVLNPTNTSRPSSQLSSSYELINTASQVNTPFTTSPTLSIPHLPPNPPTSTPETSPPPSTPSSPSNIEPNAGLPVTTKTEDMAAEIITPFHGDKEDENPEDFLRAFYRRMGDKTDDTRKAQFPYYLQADSVADDWYAGLVDNEKKTWGDVENAFRKRWPRKKQVKKTDEEYEDEIMGRKLKTEDLGKKEKVAGRDVYTHIAWADKMATSVKGAKWEKTTNHIRQVRKDLPTILREKIGTGHADWEAFLDAVRNVDVEEIRDSIDIRNKEQAAIDRRFRMLGAMHNSPTAPLRQQLSTIAISSQPPAPRTTVTGDPFTNASGGQGNLRFTANPTAPQYANAGKPVQANPIPRPPPTAEQRAELRALLNTLPQHPDTQAGRQAHQAQQAEWVKTYGFGTRVTEKTPYPLRPGTAPVNSGECFTCGQVGHLGSRTGENCQALGHRPLHPYEQQWRVICARILKEPRRVADVRYLAIDDYGTTWQGIQGNEEGPSN